VKPRALTCPLKQRTLKSATCYSPVMMMGLWIQLETEKKRASSPFNYFFLGNFGNGVVPLLEWSKVMRSHQVVVEWEGHMCSIAVFRPRPRKKERGCRALGREAQQSYVLCVCVRVCVCV